MKKVSKSVVFFLCK